MVLVSQFSVGKWDNSTFQLHKVAVLKSIWKLQSIYHTGDCLILRVKTKLHKVFCCSCCLEKSECDWITNPNVEGFSYVLTGKTGYCATAKNGWEYAERNTVLKIHSLNWYRLGSVLTQQGREFLVTFHQKAEPKLAQLWIFIKSSRNGSKKIFIMQNESPNIDYFSNWISVSFDGNKNKTFSVFSRFSPASFQSI